MTNEQRQWLEMNPEFSPVGPPRSGVKFRNCGTLYEDGEFVPMAPLKPIRLAEGCFCVGVPSQTAPQDTEEV